VLFNLMANAIEHAPGSATIDVAVRRIGPHAEVEVRDHGEGIPTDSLPTIFEPYGRLGQPRRRTGLGLGLYVAREIVIAHGGTIEVSSQAGEGTAVMVRLPLGQRPARVRASSSAKAT
jgi:signal transduction histidine kinase